MSAARPIYQEGFALFAKQDLDGAIAKYKEALAADPTFVLAWSALGMAHSRKGEIDEALAAGLKALLIVRAAMGDRISRLHCPGWRWRLHFFAPARASQVGVEQVRL